MNGYAKRLDRTLASSQGSLKSRVPEDLRAAAIRLLKHYRKSEVISALSTSSAILKSWQPQSEMEANPSRA